MNASRRTGRLRHWIVVPQVCLSLVLLLVAGALARPLLRAELTSPGYEPDGLVFADFDLSSYPRMSEVETQQFLSRRESFYSRLTDRMLQLPGAAKMALASALPFEPMRSWVIDRNAYPAGRHWWVAQAAVSAGYFDVLEMTVLRGRSSTHAIERRAAYGHRVRAARAMALARSEPDRPVRRPALAGYSHRTRMARGRRRCQRSPAAVV